MMPVRELRRRLYVIVFLLVAVDVAAAVLLIMPTLGAGGRALREYDKVRQQWHDEQRKTLPVKDIDQKIEETRGQVAEFQANRLPVRDSGIAAELARLARENGVQFSAIRYTSDETELVGLRRMQIDASVGGDYLKVVKFINALERDKMFFIIESVNLGEQQGGNVRLELKLETYLGQMPAGGGGGAAQAGAGPKG